MISPNALTAFPLPLQRVEVLISGWFGPALDPPSVPISSSQHALANLPLDRQFLSSRAIASRIASSKYSSSKGPSKGNGAKISIAFVEDGGELHAFYDGVLSGM